MDLHIIRGEPGAGSVGDGSVYEPATREFRYALAGHWEPILVPRQGPAARLASAGLPIGLFPDATYSEESVRLSPREGVYLYTDGLLDAENEAQEHFGIPMFLAHLGRYRDLALQEGLDRLIADLERWTGSADLQDDVSVLAL